MTLGDWENRVKQMTSAELVSYKQSIEGLKGWDTFKEAFGWTGIFTITAIIDVELTRRMPNAVILRVRSESPTLSKLGKMLTTVFTREVILDWVRKGNTLVEVNVRSTDKQRVESYIQELPWVSSVVG